MSRTRIISSCPRSNVVVRTSDGDWRSPAVSSAYARATRSGVSRSPSRSGSSPRAISSSRTAATARSWSKGGTSAIGRSAQAIGSVIPVSGGRRRWLRGGARSDRAAVHVAARSRGREDAAGVRLGPRAVDLGAVADLLRDLDRRDLGRVAVGRAGPGRARRALAQRLEDRRDLLLIERLLVHQLEDEGVEDVAVLLEDVERLLVGGRKQLLGLLVDRRSDRFCEFSCVTRRRSD